MTITSCIALVVGLLLLAWGVWERSGRSRNARAWTRSRYERAWRNAMFTRPGVGLVLAILGAFGLVRDVPVLGSVLAFVAVIAVILTFWWGIFAFPCPRWAVPEFARERWLERHEKGWP